MDVRSHRVFQHRTLPVLYVFTWQCFKDAWDVGLWLGLFLDRCSHVTRYILEFCSVFNYSSESMQPAYRAHGCRWCNPLYNHHGLHSDSDSDSSCMQIVKFFPNVRISAVFSSCHYSVEITFSDILKNLSSVPIIVFVRITHIIGNDFVLYCQ